MQVVRMVHDAICDATHDNHTWSTEGFVRDPGRMVHENKMPSYVFTLAAFELRYDIERLSHTTPHDVA